MTKLKGLTQLARWLHERRAKGKATGHLCRALINSNSLLRPDTDAEIVSLFAREHSSLSPLILIAGMMDQHGFMHLAVSD
jgi:hypothetical protein